MRSTTRAPSALALHSAVWPSAGTCPAELGEGHLSCDLTWISDHWILREASGRGRSASCRPERSFCGLRTSGGCISRTCIARAMKKKTLPEITKMRSNMCSGDITVHLKLQGLPIDIRRLVGAFMIFYCSNHSLEFLS